MKSESLPALVLGAIGLLGCSPAAPPTAAQPTPAPAPTHNHNHAERVELGQVELAGHRVSVFQVAPVVPGQEGDFDLDFAGTTALPDAVRGWIGIESGLGSVKVRFARETERRMHGHPEAPAPLPAGAKFWLEIEGAAGKAKAAFDCRP